MSVCFDSSEEVLVSWDREELLISLREFWGEYAKLDFPRSLGGGERGDLSTTARA